MKRRRANDKKFDVLTKAIESLKPVQNGLNEPSMTSAPATQSPPAYEAPARSYDKLLLMVKEAWEAVEADELLALEREMPVRCDAQGG